MTVSTCIATVSAAGKWTESSQAIEFLTEALPGARAWPNARL